MLKSATIQLKERNPSIYQELPTLTTYLIFSITGNTDLKDDILYQITKRKYTSSHFHKMTLHIIFPFTEV